MMKPHRGRHRNQFQEEDEEHGECHQIHPSASRHRGCQSVAVLVVLLALFHIPTGKSRVAMSLDRKSISSSGLLLLVGNLVRILCRLSATGTAPSVPAVHSG